MTTVFTDDPRNFNPPKDEITFLDSSFIDDFGRVRMGLPVGLFESKQISSGETYKWETRTTGSGTAIWSYNSSSTRLTVGTAAGDRVIQQTRQYFSYTSGFAQKILMTATFGEAKTNVNQYCMYGDDLNGFGIALIGTELNVITRTNTSGSPVPTLIPRSKWVDHLDGTGRSRYIFDLTKSFILGLSFQWLGVGRQRVSFDIDGQEIICVEINNANNRSGVYMRTPSLPVRYEIINTGTTTGPTSLERICTAVYSEGGYQVPGIEFSAGLPLTERVSVTTEILLFAIGLKNEFPAGKPNRKTVRFLNLDVSVENNDATFFLRHIHGVTSITGGSGPLSVDDDSAVQIYKSLPGGNNLSLTASYIHPVKGKNLPSSTGTSGVIASIPLEYINAHSFITQNFESTQSDMFGVYASAPATAALCAGFIDWIETE